MDIATELATCRLLLGDMSGAEAVLGLAPAADGAPPPDPDVLAFVQVEHRLQPF